MTFRPVALLLAGFVSLWAQAPATAPPPQNNGLVPAWEMGPILQEIGAHAERLMPVLHQIHAVDWVQKGASDTYAAQLQSAEDQASSIASGARALAQNPEKLSAGLELYFRIEGLDQMVGSLLEGIRKYQDEKLAGDLASLAAENGPNRARFRNYLINLASQREQECAVMDKEAQRCRSIVATQPPPQPPKTNRGRTK